MKPEQNRMNEHNKKTITIAAIVLIVAGIGWYCWSTYARYHKGIPDSRTFHQQSPQQNSAMSSPDQQKSAPQNSPMPSARERSVRFARFLNELNLTKEQKHQVLKLGPPKGPEDFSRRREHLQKILTPEQMKQLQKTIRAHLRGRLNKTLRYLGPEDQEAFLRRIQKRMESRGAFRQEQNDRNTPR